MKYFKLFVLLVSFITITQRAVAQDLKLTNVVVVGMTDNQDDRYSLEINLTELFSSKGIKAIPSLNLIKQGGDSRVIAGDSMSGVLSTQGFDTYLLVTIRGYDKRYKSSESQPDFAQAMEAGTLYKLYQEDVVSVSVELKFYRGGKCIHTEMIKCGNVGSRDSVLKKIRKKVGKLIDRKWK